MLMDTFADGWTAFVDDERTPIFRAFGLYRAVAVPEGTHVVEFHYLAPGLVSGSIVSAIAALICLIALVRPVPSALGAPQPVLRQSVAE